MIDVSSYRNQMDDDHDDDHDKGTVIHRGRIVASHPVNPTPGVRGRATNMAQETNDEPHHHDHHKIHDAFGHSPPGRRLEWDVTATWEHHLW